jgi:hypothetical protein
VKQSSPPASASTRSAYPRGDEQTRNGEGSCRACPRRRAKSVAQTTRPFGTKSASGKPEKVAIDMRRNRCSRISVKNAA